MGAMPLPGGIPSPAAVQLRSGPNAFEDEVLRRGIASIDAPALPEMTSQTIARPSGSMDPHSLGGYKQLSNTFGMTRDRAGNLSAVAQAPSVDAIREGQLTSQMAVPVMPRFFKEGGEAVASPSLLEYIQQQGEEAPIDTDPMGTAQQLLSNVVRVDRRPAPTRQSVKRVSRGAGRDAAATDPMGMKIPSLTESKQMELDTSSSPAESQYKGTAREQMEELARTYQLKINAAKNKARGLAADTFGAPTLEQPTLAKRSLTKRSFATGGEVKGAAPDQAPKVTGINRILDFVAQRLPADAFPTAGRVLLESVQGKRDPITESSFSKDELEVLRQLTRGDKGSVAYSDYQNLVNQFRAQGKDADATSSLFSLGSPIGNVRNTLGRFNYTRDPRGNVVIEDSYDFNPPDANMTQEARTGDYGTFGPYNLIRDYAGEKIPPGSGRNVRINLGLVERSQNISPEKPKNKLRR